MCAWHPKKQPLLLKQISNVSLGIILEQVKGGGGFQGWKHGGETKNMNSVERIGNCFISLVKT